MHKLTYMKFVIPKKTLDKVKKDICCNETFIAKTTIHAVLKQNKTYFLKTTFKQKI